MVGVRYIRRSGFADACLRRLPRAKATLKSAGTPASYFTLLTPAFVAWYRDVGRCDERTPLFRRVLACSLPKEAYRSAFGTLQVGGAACKLGSGTRPPPSSSRRVEILLISSAIGRGQRINNREEGAIAAGQQARRPPTEKGKRAAGLSLFLSSSIRQALIRIYMHSRQEQGYAAYRHRRL